MSCDLESYLDGWDRTFLDLSSKLSEPLCRIWEFGYRLRTPLEPQKFGNRATLTEEIAVRVLIGLGFGIGAFFCLATPVPLLSSALLLGLGSKALRAIGFALQKEGFTHIRGSASETILNAKDLKIKVMNLNACGVGGGLSLDHGGMSHWRYRLDAMVATILKENPDVLVLQEIYDTALAEALIEKLTTHYAHFFTHLGPNVWGSVGGCMVLSKCAVHHFSNTPFINNSWTLNRGFAILELKASPGDASPCARIIGTHLIHGNEPVDQAHRMVQVAQIADSLAHRTLPLPTLLAGDLNIERDREEGSLLSFYLHHGYQGAEPTCTNRWLAEWTGKEEKLEEETIDYLSLFKSTLPDGSTLPAIDTGVVLEGCHLVEEASREPLSDHRGMVATVSLPAISQCADVNTVHGGLFIKALKDQAIGRIGALSRHVRMS